MKLYFGGSISGGRKYLDTYRAMVEYLKDEGHTILTEHVVQPNVLEMENQFSPGEIYSRDIQWIKECDALIAEVSNPSLGVGYEICYALNLDKPVLGLYKDGIFLTRMLTGNSSPGLMIKAYKTGKDWQETLDLFLKGLS